jgi:carboxyl-terminal processing protease
MTRTLLRLLVVLVVPLVAIGLPSAAMVELERAEQQLEDFDALDRFVRDSYALFELKQTDWSKAVADLRPQAAQAKSEGEFLHALEAALDQLYDAHCMLNTHADGSWRPAPRGIWVVAQDGRFVVTAVERGSRAAASGVLPGDELLAIDGVPFAEQVAQRRPRFLRKPDPLAEEWALASAAAGRHNQADKWLVRRDGKEALLEPPAAVQDPELVEWSLSDDDIGRIAISSFADPRAVELFDRALEALRGTRGLVIDLRSNRGGDTAVARPMLGRLIAERRQYAWMARREGSGLGPRWPEFVEPRGPWTYSAPVVVVVDRFSVSMAEGFAMALRSMNRGTLVGTEMARLGAAVGRTVLPHSGISVQISTEPVYAVDGTPRWELEPDVRVDPLAESPGDPFERAALSVLSN